MTPTQAGCARVGSQRSLLFAWNYGGDLGVQNSCGVGDQRSKLLKASTRKGGNKRPLHAQKPTKILGPVQTPDLRFTPQCECSVQTSTCGFESSAGAGSPCWLRRTTQYHPHLAGGALKSCLQRPTMAARMLRAFTLMTLAAVLVAPSLALDVPALSSACLADRTSGCCPGAP